ncbi:MAG: peptide deformylase [Bdellovibrionales bacterium]|nr:peptide deformylase [Bdellovibrionales bacterium]
MAKLEILKYPDPRLRHKAKPVGEVTPELRQLAEDMLETMYAEKGIGLAAIQVGVEVQLLVIDTRRLEEDGRYDVSDMTEAEQKIEQPIVIFNPQITKKDGKTTFDEGCLSVPGYYETVQRANTIQVEGLDRHGQKMVLELDGLLAICMQHEMDHLDGKVFIDRLSPIKAMRLKSKIKKFGYDKGKSSGKMDELLEESEALKDEV